MAKPSLNLNSAENIMSKIDKKRAAEIRKMFSDMAKEVAKKAEQLKGKDKISSAIQQQYLQDLEKELKKQMNADFAKLRNNIEGDIEETAKSVIACVREFEESIGLPISKAWLNVPVDAVTAVAGGDLYAGNWTLSSRIWGVEQKVLKDIHTVVAKGIAENMSAYDIAKDLEKYVNPRAKKDWSWSKVYPGTNKRVDYSAQRLARTMVTHAYQFSFQQSTKDNPFITKYKWISSHDDRVCEICKKRNGKLFDKDKVPLDHPNGRCTLVSVFDKSMSRIGDDLAKWYKSPQGTMPKIDEYMKKRFGTERFEKAMQFVQQGAESGSREIMSKEIMYNAKKPVRPKKRDFGSDEAYEKAKEKYYVQKEEYNKLLDEWVSKNIFDTMSKDEMNKWAELNGVKIGNVDGLDTRVVRAYSKRFEKLSKDFPKVISYHREIGVDFTIDFDSSAMFEAAANWGMRFGASYKDYEDAIKNFADTRVGGEWFVRGDGTINGLFDHEFGHQVESAIRGAGTDRWDKTRDLEKDLIESVYGKDGMSEYASSHPEELFAEGFAAWYGGEETEFAKAFGKFLERWIKL